MNTVVSIVLEFIVLLAMNPAYTKTECKHNLNLYLKPGVECRRLVSCPTWRGRGGDPVNGARRFAEQRCSVLPYVP